MINRKNDTRVHVFVARIPLSAEGKIASHERAKEIESCTSSEVRRQKFAVWKLLERALFEALGLKIGELDLTRTENGKWECSACKFSLSHSGEVVAVAVSEEAVGVDVEKYDPPRFAPLVEKIATADEYADLCRLKEGERGEALNVLWTRKEALFKLRGGKTFLPKSVETQGCGFITKSVVCGGERYFLSVACEDPESVDFRLEEGVDAF